MTIKRFPDGYAVECDTCEMPVVANQRSMTAALGAFDKARGRTYQNSRDEMAHQCAKCRKD